MGQQSFARDLHRGNGTLLALRDRKQTLGGSGLGRVEIKVVAYKVKECLAPNKFARTPDSMSIASRFGLRHEGDVPQTFAKGLTVAGIVARANHHADLFDAGPKNLLHQNPQHRFLLAIMVEKCLQRQYPLTRCGGGNDCLSDSHLGSSLEV
jgi:hypothetical protein